MTAPAVRCPNPPTASELRAALNRLPAGVSASAAALHLALPEGEVLGIALALSRRSCHYRGITIDMVSDPAEAAAAVAAAGHRDGDSYLDLTGPAVRWCKLVRSGTRRILFGSDTLFAAPLIALETGVDDDAAFTALDAYLEGQLPSAPAVLDTAEGPVLVDSVGGSWVLRSPHAIAPRAAAGEPIDLEGLAAEIAADLGAVGTETVVLSATGGRVRAEVVCDLPGGWEAIIPATITYTSELLGVPSGEVAHAAAGPLPQGFSWRGRSTWEDAAVACHDATGLVVLIRPACPGPMFRP